MEISAAGSATSMMQQMPVQVRQERPATTERPPENTVTQSPQPQRPPPPPQEARSAENPERPQRPEPPKPVVNAQGQKTGTIINTTA